MTTSPELSHISTSPDVLVIGAGAAGVAAVVGVLQTGSSVLIVEKNEYPGGKATAAFVGTICGLYLTSSDKNPSFVVNGFPKLFGERLMQLSETQPEYQKGGLHFFPYNREAFIKLSSEFLSHAEVSYHTFVNSIQVREKNIYEVEIEKHNHSLKIYPRVVIDCSGEAITSELTNSEQLVSDEYQAAAQVFSIGRLPAADSAALSLSLVRTIKKGIESNSFPQAYERVSVVPGTYKQGSALFKLGIPHVVDNSQSRIAEIELFSKDAVHKIHDYLKSNSEIFANSIINFIAPETGIRTGPRNEGKYILHEDDVLSCRKFNDAVARGSWPIEYWAPGKNVEMSYFKEDDFYDIPADCLNSKSLNNLYFAGRNISATDKAIASARVIGTCLQTGFAAGMLAGGKVKSIPEQNIIQQIQQLLFKNESK